MFIKSPAGSLIFFLQNHCRIWKIVALLKIGKIIFIFASHLKSHKDNVDRNGVYHYFKIIYKRFKSACT